MSETQQGEDTELSWEHDPGTLYDDDVVRTLEDAQQRAAGFVGAQGGKLTGEVHPSWKTMLVEVALAGEPRFVVVPRSGGACFLAPAGVGAAYCFEADQQVIAREGYWPTS